MRFFFPLSNGDLSSIVKIGEGTYGEAFKAGATVCKIVPVDGDMLVNGEVQKVLNLLLLLSLKNICNSPKSRMTSSFATEIFGAA